MPDKNKVEYQQKVKEVCIKGFKFSLVKMKTCSSDFNFLFYFLSTNLLIKKKVFIGGMILSIVKSIKTNMSIVKVAVVECPTWKLEGCVFKSVVKSYLRL